MYLFDLFLSDLRLWRKLRGGEWYLIDTDDHPQARYWSRVPPYRLDTVLDRERF